MKRNKTMWSRSLLLLFIVLFSTNIHSQKKDIDLKKGNRAFNEGKYADAEANYRVEKSKTDNKSSAVYNLGNAIYKQKSYEESKAAYLQAVEQSTNKTEKHRAYHNLGNVLMQEKNYQAAVEAYKNALRNNPYDEKTRYNYALAKDMLEKNPPPPDQNQDDKDKENQDQEQDQNKENQKGGDNQDQDNKDNQDQQDKDQQDNKDQKPEGNQDQNPEGEQNGIPKQHIENLLEAVENQEKGIQKRVQNQKELEQKKMQPRQTDKNW